MTTPVNEIVARVNNTALKHWLRLHKKKYSASNKEALALLIEKQIDKGDLSEEEFNEAVREIDEYGNKRVYLRRLINPSLLKEQDKCAAHLGSFDIDLSAKPKSPKRHFSKPKLGYAHWSSGEVRIMYSEMHTFRRADLKLGVILTEERPVRIVISADSKNGLLRVFMDPPGQDHSHLNDEGVASEKTFEDFYMAKAEDFVGGSVHLDLYEPIELLAKLEPPLFELRRNKVLDQDNVECTYQGSKNLRQSRSYRAAVENDTLPCIYKNVSGKWMHEQSNNELFRNIGMQVNTEESMLKFPAHCVASEVEYAISTITTVQKRTA